MTLTDTPTAAHTPVADWLLPTSTETRLRLENVMKQPKSTGGNGARPLRTLTDVARRVLLEEIETKLRMVLGETLVDLVIAGWRKHAAVTEALQKSRSQPGVDQIVSLAKHSVTTRHDYSLDIEVDRVRVMTLTVEMVMAAQLCDVVAVARDGRVVAIRSGNAKADGSVTVDDVQIGHRTLAFPLTAELTLRGDRRN
jgi:hypothetical protein